MEPSIYTSLKVNNEYEACRVFTMEAKEMLESYLLKNRISYFIKWEKPRLFSKKQEACVFCVNENSLNEVTAAVNAMPEEYQADYELLIVPSRNEFL